MRLSRIIYCPSCVYQALLNRSRETPVLSIVNSGYLQADSSGELLNALQVQILGSHLSANWRRSTEQEYSRCQSHRALSSALKSDQLTASEHTGARSIFPPTEDLSRPQEDTDGAALTIATDTVRILVFLVGVVGSRSIVLVVDPELLRYSLLRLALFLRI